MKKILLSIFCSGLTGIASSQILGNLVSIVPDTAMQGQTLTTTITQPQGSWVMASPPCDNYGIYLERQGEIIYSNSFQPIWMDQVEAEFTIPQNATPGFYNVYLAGATWDPWSWQCSTIGYWEMLNGFEITGGLNSIVGPEAITKAWVNYDAITNEIKVQQEIPNSDLEIYDYQGRTIFRRKLNGKDVSVQLNLSSGIYYYRIDNITGKFPVQRN
jgi:hypothetical protein